VGRGEFVHRAARANRASTFEYYNADSRAHGYAGRAHLHRASIVESGNADQIKHARANTITDAMKNKKPGEEIFSPGFFVELFLLHKIHARGTDRSTQK
jgi:hypothetical protein